MIDGRHFPSLGVPVTFTWYPDRVVREAMYNGLHYRSVAALAVDKTAAIVDVVVENRSGEAREVEVGFNVQGSRNEYDKQLGRIPTAARVG